MQKKQNWYFTFGYGHAYPDGYVKIHGTFAEAREKMFERFGPKWAFQYDEEAFMPQIERWNMYDVDEGVLWSKKQTIVHRVCRFCGERTEVVRNWIGPNPNETIECPKCHKFGLDLKTKDQVDYMHWKCTIGAGKQLREIIREYDNASANKKKR